MRHPDFATHHTPFVINALQGYLLSKAVGKRSFMSARIWSKEVASVVVVSALTCLNAGAAQVPDQNENSNRPPLKRATKTTSKQSKSQPIYLTPKVAEILRLNKSGISDDVVVAYIEKSPTDYLVTPRQLISLRDAGLSERVLKVLAEHRSPTEEELGYPAAGAPPGAQALYEGMNSNGRWVYVSGYGWCWQPTATQASLFNEPFGYDSLAVPPMYSSIIVGDGGFGYPNAPYVDHHGHHGTNSQHMAQHQRRPTAPNTGHMTPSGSTLARVPNAPFGVFGARTPVMSQSPFSPVSSSWLAPRPSELAPNIPYFQMGRGQFGVLPSSPSLGLSGTISPLLPIGGQVPSGTLPPYGIAGMPLMPNNGLNPYLPVGGTPASGSLPPYSIAGVPFTPSSGAYPYLPVGGHPADGSLPPYGVVMAPPGGYPMSPVQQSGFEFLQPSFHFLQPSFSFLPNTGTLAPGPVTSPSLSAYAYAGFHGGWGGGYNSGFGGFHGGGGGFHGGGGGGGGHR